MELIIMIIVHEIGVIMISNWEQCPWNCGHNDLKLVAKRVIYQKIAGMIAGIKVSFLTCKCVFYRPEHDAEF